jgi:hypothetical protein
MNSSLRIIFIIAVLMLIIILLSGIKVCSVPLTMKLGDVFVDKKYKYISEPFAVSQAQINAVKDVKDNYTGNVLVQAAGQAIQNEKIKNIDQQITDLSNTLLQYQTLQGNI